ncbi:MAG: DUF5131 family protein [Dehalococcoidia bacterium]
MSGERHQTGIQWTHVPGYRGATWNPTTGCTRVSAGCDHCYAFELHDQRFATQRKAAVEFAVGTGGHFTGAARDIRLMRENGARLPFPAQYDVPFSTVQVLDEKRLTEPLRRRIPTAYFVDSMADLFHEEVPDEFLDRVFAVMALRPQHLFMVLTKRPSRMHDYLTRRDRDEAIGWAADTLYEEHGGDYSRVNLLLHFGIHGGPRGWPLPNVWLGVSVEDQAAADERIPWLLDTPTAVRFLSCEPLLGAVDLMSIPYLISGYTEPPYDDRIDWVIAGGESGQHARLMDLAWARSLRDQCAAAGVPFFMKQLGSRPTSTGWDGAASTLWPPDDFGLEGPWRREGESYFRKLRNSHGADPEEWPEDLRVRQWPEVAS